MSQPPAYVRAYNFSNYQTSNPSDPLPGNQVDAELNAVKTTLDGVRTNIALIQRDDGNLANTSVHPDSLDAVTRALMVTDWTPRGLWGTGAIYAVKDVVEQSGLSYICTVAHTAGVFATDQAAGKWLLLGGLGQASDIAFSPTGSVAATDVQGAIEELDAENQSEHDAIDASIAAVVADVAAAEAAIVALGVAKEPAFTDAGSKTVEAAGSVTARSLAARFADTFNVKDFGAIGDGASHPLSERYATFAEAQADYPHAAALTDEIDWAAIQGAINALPVNGGTIYFPTGDYAVNRTVSVGDGTSVSRSTTAGIKLIGIAGGGVGLGERGAPLYGARLLWTGATSTTAAVLRINGPIHSCVFEDFLIDGADKAGYGVEAAHLYQCRFTNVQVERYTTRGWYLHVYAAAQPFGVTQGFMENLFTQCTARDPASTAAETGFYLDGDDANNIGFSRNIFIGCTTLIGGNAGTRGFYLGFVDNNTFIECFTAWSAAATSGVGVYFNQGANLNMPQENMFYNSPIVGGVGGTSGTGCNMFFGYPLADAEPVPTIANIKTILRDGRLSGGWAGSIVHWSGRADPGSGLTTTAKYFAPTGVSVGGAVANAANMIVPTGQRLVSLRTKLDGAPGVGASRTCTVYINGVATALSTAYGAAESGDRRDTADINVLAGDEISVFWGVTGVPANFSAKWALEFYPLEVT